MLRWDIYLCRWNGISNITTNESHVSTLTGLAANGCDSLLTENITSLAMPATGLVAVSICYGESYTYEDGTTSTTITADESHTSILPGATMNMCDSTVTESITVLPELTGTNNTTICAYGSVVINGNTYDAINSTGIEVFNNIGPNNCDSTVAVNLIVLSAIDISTSVSGVTITANQAGATYQWIDCDNSNSEIPGATNANYVASLNGNYAVVITVGPCSDTSACENISTIGIVESDFENDFQISPNPTSGNFSIDLGKNYKNVTITLTDLSGKIIQSNTYNDSQLLNLKLEESAGVYLLMIQSENKKAIVRLVKQ